MKKTYLVMLVLISLLLSTFMVSDADQKQHQAYDLNVKNNNVGIDLGSFQKAGINVQQKQLINQLAKDKSVTLVITNYDQNTKTYTKIISDNMVGMIEEVLQVKNDSKLPYSTINKENINRNIPDILNNDKYIYETISNSLDVSWDGTIQVGYDEPKQYENFITQLAAILELDSNSINSYQLGETYYNPLINYILGFGLIISFLIYQLLLVQQIISNSNIIGILILMGYDNKHLVRKIFGKDYLFIILTTVIITIISFFVPNLPLTIAIKIFLVNILILGITYLSDWLLIKQLVNRKNIARVIKHETIIKKLPVMNIFIHTLTCFLVILIALIESNFLSQALKYQQEKNKIAYLLDYGVIYSFDDQYLQARDFHQLNELYAKILDNDYLRTHSLYAEFSSYKVTLPGTQVQDGYQYDDLYAAVDNNYLKQEQIAVYDENGTEVILPEENTEDIFIFPKQYVKDQKAVIKYYYRLRNQEVQTPKIYYYNNKVVHTYLNELVSYDSPVFNLVRKDNQLQYFFDPSGLSLMGIQMNSALKFEASDQTEINVQLKHVFNDLGVGKLFNSNCFKTYGEYYNQLLAKENTAILIASIVLAMILVLYFFASSQYILLYITENNRLITVKHFLGHSPIKIYNHIYFNNLLVFLACTICVIIIDLFANLGNLPIFIILDLGLLLLMFILIFIITNHKDRQQLTKDLKGGY